MKSISCIAIDDEPLALLVISRFCERKGGIDLTTFNEPRVGLQEILRRKPDLVFLDIEMNSINGLDLAKSLPEECCLIFTTAHAKYALEGFDLDAVDFLHKPFAYERFERAVDKAIRYMESKNSETFKYDIHNTIILKQEYNSIAIPIDDIMYIEALGNYIKIFRTNGNTVLSHINMKALQEMLPPNAFIRAHRSYMIPVNKIERFSKREIWLRGMKRPIPIGRYYSQDVYNSLVNGNMPQEK